jgi:phosphatidylinositol glycan class K
MLAEDDVACSLRNCMRGHVALSEDGDNLYTTSSGQLPQIDWRGDQVTVENFLRVLTGRLEEGVSRNKRLLSNSKSNVLVYLTGHGGDEFLKFQDKEELTSQDLADAFQQMKAQGRFNELLFMVDTCQASTLQNRFYTEGIVSIGSSKLGQNSYSKSFNSYLGLSQVDRFTFYALDYFRKHKDVNSSLLNFVSYYFFDVFDLENSSKALNLLN